MSLCFWVHNIPKFKASSLEETIGFFSFIFSSLKDNFFFKISLSKTLIYFVVILMAQLCLLLLFQKKKLDDIMRMIFQFQLGKFCICSFQDHIMNIFHILNLWLLSKSLLLISLIFHLNLLILFLYLLELLLHLVNPKLNLNIQKFIFFLLMYFLHQFQI